MTNMGALEANTDHIHPMRKSKVQTTHGKHQTSSTEATQGCAPLKTNKTQNKKKSVFIQREMSLQTISICMCFLLTCPYEPHSCPRGPYQVPTCHLEVSWVQMDACEGTTNKSKKTETNKTQKHVTCVPSYELT